MVNLSEKTGQKHEAGTNISPHALVYLFMVIGGPRSSCYARRSQTQKSSFSQRWRQLKGLERRCEQNVSDQVW